MKKILAIFVALAFLAGTTGISMAQTGTGKPKVSHHKKAHTPKKHKK